MKNIYVEKLLKITPVLIVISLFLSSCAEDDKNLIIGVWESEQIDQKEGANEEIVNYNHLEVTEASINAKTFNFVSIEGGEVQKVFNEKEKIMNYKLQDNDKIMLDDSLYEIGLTKKEMVIKNENIEIHYYKTQ